MAKQVTKTSEFRALFASTRTIAVVGAHSEPSRAAYYVPEYLFEQGFRIIAVNPSQVGMLMWGEPAYATLAEIPGPVDVVCVFRRSDKVGDHTKDLLAMAHRPTTVWLQLGITNQPFAARMVAEGIDVVQDRCMLVEHKALGLGATG